MVTLISLKQWEKRSYKAYNIDESLDEILYAESNAWKDIIKDYILDTDVFELGANCIDIYLVAYVAENYGKGKEKFTEYIFNNEISDKINSAQAIWQVGKGRFDFYSSGRGIFK